MAVFGHSHVRRATTLNFGPISTKLGGIVWAIKKMTQKDNGPGPGQNYRISASIVDIVSTNVSLAMSTESQLCMRPMQIARCAMSRVKTRAIL